MLILWLGIYLYKHLRLIKNNKTYNDALKSNRIHYQLLRDESTIERLI